MTTQANESGAAPVATTATAAPAASVAPIVATLRAGIRQRTAERSVLAGAASLPAGTLAPSPQIAAQLVELRSRELVQEPMAFSPRPGIGRLLVFARRATFKLFMTWYLHPILQSQNAFNQAASRLLQQLASEQERLRQDLATYGRGPRR